MQVSEALERVSAAYAPGVAAHFQRYPQDPWWQAHEDLERVMQIQDPELTQAAAVTFHNRCLELIERFKREGRESPQPSNRDAFNMTVDQVEAHFSRRRKVCSKCPADKNLRIRSVPGTMKVVLICKECEEKK